MSEDRLLKMLSRFFRARMSSNEDLRALILSIYGSEVTSDLPDDKVPESVMASAAASLCMSHGIDREFWPQLLRWRERFQRQVEEMRLVWIGQSQQTSTRQRAATPLSARELQALRAVIASRIEVTAGVVPRLEAEEEQSGAHRSTERVCKLALDLGLDGEIKDAVALVDTALAADPSSLTAHRRLLWLCQELNRGHPGLGFDTLGEAILDRLWARGPVWSVALTVSLHVVRATFAQQRCLLGSERGEAWQFEQALRSIQGNDAVLALRVGGPRELIAAWNVVQLLAALAQCHPSVIPDDHRARLSDLGGCALRRVLDLLHGEDRSAFKTYILGIREEYDMLHAPNWTADWEALGAALERAENQEDRPRHPGATMGSSPLRQFLGGALLLLGLSAPLSSPEGSPIAARESCSIVMDGTMI